MTSDSKEHRDRAYAAQKDNVWEGLGVAVPQMEQCPQT
eukprot:SAG31_NODE_18095_length_647_cov_0.859489_2_plen_37_part_01